MRRPFQFGFGWRLRALLLPCAVAASLMTLPLPVAPQGKAGFEAVLAKAQEHFRNYDFDQALTFYKRANAMKGNTCAECLWGMAQAYSKLGANQNVLETCDRVAAAAPSNQMMSARALNLKGITWADMAMQDMDQPDTQRLADAAAAFRRVLELQPDFEITRYNLGVTLIRLDRESEGVAELQKYVATARTEDEDIVASARKTIANPQLARQNYAPEFLFNTVDGKRVSSEELRGKVVLVDFWGTWCRPCVISVPALASLNRRFSEQPFALISISSDWDYENWRSFIKRYQMSWPQGLDDSKRLQRAFAVNSFPTYVLIDHAGIIRYRSSGYGPTVEDELASQILRALSAAKDARNP